MPTITVTSSLRIPLWSPMPMIHLITVQTTTLSMRVLYNYTPPNRGLIVLPQFFQWRTMMALLTIYLLQRAYHSRVLPQWLILLLPPTMSIDLQKGKIHLLLTYLHRLTSPT